MVNESGEFHFHVEYAVASDEAGFEDIPGGRNVYLDERNAVSVAQDYLFLQEAIYRGYLKDEKFPGKFPGIRYVGKDDLEPNVVFQAALDNVHTGDVLTVRTVRCDAPKIRVSDGEDAVSQLLAALFGAGGGGASFAVIAVGENGNAEVQETDAYGTAIPAGILGEGLQYDPLMTESERAGLPNDPAEFFKALFSVPPTTDIDGEENGFASLFGNYSGLQGGLQKVS